MYSATLSILRSSFLSSFLLIIASGAQAGVVVDRIDYSFDATASGQVTTTPTTGAGAGIPIVTQGDTYADSRSESLIAPTGFTDPFTLQSQDSFPPGSWSVVSSVETVNSSVEFSSSSNNTFSFQMDNLINRSGGTDAFGWGTASTEATIFFTISDIPAQLDASWFGWFFDPPFGDANLTIRKDGNPLDIGWELLAWPFPQSYELQPGSYEIDLLIESMNPYYSGATSSYFDISVTTVPEVSTIVLTASAAIVMVVVRRHRKRSNPRLA